mgnify:CR=1 FL=1
MTAAMRVFDLSLGQMLWSRRTVFLGLIVGSPLALGATDEGAPGLRAPTFYMSYFRDLDGNKLDVFSYG